MAKTVLSALAFLILASVAQAEPATETPDSAVAGRHQDHWLSDGLNRLVFWQAPIQSGRSVATKPTNR